LQYFEDLNLAANAEIGPKGVSDMASKKADPEGYRAFGVKGLRFLV